MNQDELAKILKQAKKEYYTTGESELSDPEYDALEAQLKKLNPDHPVLQMVGYEIEVEEVPEIVEEKTIEQLMKQRWVTQDEAIRLRKHFDEEHLKRYYKSINKPYP